MTKQYPASIIRKSVAKALGIKTKDLGCFTITDHDDQPTIILMHGGPYQGVHIESSNSTHFITQTSNN